ncbi:MAG: dihydropteroate synthase [Prevotella sp.]|nr:dihydropteroate synthase [Prevotella sp.]
MENVEREHSVNIRGRLIELKRPIVMGILNVTPDSFYAASRKQTEQEIAERAREIVRDGGSIIDIGACSTRPGAGAVSQNEEAERLRVALAVIRQVLPDAMISVDTFRPEVARRCIEEWGADIINDVGSLPSVTTAEERHELMNAEMSRRDEMFHLVAEQQVPYILMSSQPDAESMLIEWAEQLSRLRAWGAKDIILDPGFGFGKTTEQNHQLLRDLRKLTVAGCPLLVGVSRKSMIWKRLGITPEQSLNGTTILHTLAVERGASILRVHDVREAVEVVKLVEEEFKK